MVGFSLENSILYCDTVAAREEQLQEQFATLTLRLSEQEALINWMKDQVRFFLVAFIGKSLIGLQMNMPEHHLNYSQDRTIAAENKATEAWACL